MIASFLRSAAPIAVDAAGVAGAGLIAAGAWSIWTPIGMIVAGAELLVGAVLWSARAS